MAHAGRLLGKIHQRHRGHREKNAIRRVRSIVDSDQSSRMTLSILCMNRRYTVLLCALCVSVVNAYLAVLIRFFRSDPWSKCLFR